MITSGTAMITSTNALVGNWDTSWAKAATNVEIKANGQGTYGDGTLAGTFNADNTVYKGIWTQTNGHVGEFEFTLKAPVTFQGTFTRTSPQGPGGPWNGTKVA
jgi:hypothetical protein